MQLTANSSIFINEDFIGISIISSIAKFFTKLYNQISKLPLRAFQIVLLLGLVLLFAILSPVFYILILLLFKKATKSISIIDSKLSNLSISELVEIQKSMLNKFTEKGINPSDLIVQQKNTPLFLKPLFSVVNDYLKQFNELNLRIEKQVSSHYDYFEKALETNSLIGDNEEL